MATKFFKCRHCGNVVEKVVDSGVPVVCCGKNMEELIPNTVEASGEKHIPVVTRVDDCSIKVEVPSRTGTTVRLRSTKTAVSMMFQEP